MTRYRSFTPSTGAFILKPEENEKSEPFSNRKQVRIFLVWWARVARRAALLKKPHWGFFARRDASAVPQLFESTRGGVTLGFLQKKKTGVFSTLVFLVERSNLNPNHCPLGHLWRQFHRK